MDFKDIFIKNLDTVIKDINEETGLNISTLTLYSNNPLVFISNFLDNDIGIFKNVLSEVYCTINVFISSEGDIDIDGVLKWQDKRYAHGGDTFSINNEKYNTCLNNKEGTRRLWLKYKIEENSLKSIKQSLDYGFIKIIVKCKDIQPSTFLFQNDKGLDFLIYRILDRFLYNKLDISKIEIFIYNGEKFVVYEKKKEEAFSMIDKYISEKDMKGLINYIKKEIY